MRKCASCGTNHLKRVHRTFWERFIYLAVYECRSCHAVEFVSRPYRYHFLGPCPQCPRCGTVRVTRLRGRDPIDLMAGGFLNVMERLAGGKLHHCCYCRVQFYDRRKAASQIPAAREADPAT